MPETNSEKLQRVLSRGVGSVGQVLSKWIVLPLQLSLMAFFFLYALVWAKELYPSYHTVGIIIYLTAILMGLVFVWDFGSAFVREWNQPSHDVAGAGSTWPFVAVAIFPVIVVATVGLSTSYKFHEPLLQATDKLLRSLLT